MAFFIDQMCIAIQIELSRINDSLATKITNLCFTWQQRCECKKPSFENHLPYLSRL